MLIDLLFEGPSFNVLRLLAAPALYIQSVLKQVKARVDGAGLPLLIPIGQAWFVIKGDILLFQQCSDSIFPAGTNPPPPRRFIGQILGIPPAAFPCTIRNAVS